MGFWENFCLSGRLVNRDKWGQRVFLLNEAHDKEVKGDIDSYRHICDRAPSSNDIIASNCF